METRTEKTGLSWKRKLIVILGIIATIWSCIRTADLIADRALSFAFPDSVISYGSVWVRLRGGASISDVDIAPIDGDEQDIYHFDKITVEIPFVQFYRSTWDLDLLSRLPSVKDVTLHLEGGKGMMSWPLSRELMIFGTASASPFEAEGCAEDTIWSAEEFPGMGLKAKPADLMMAWHRKSGRIVKEQSIETPGVGRVDYRGEVIVHNKEPLLSWIEKGGDELALSEWHVADQGFVAARNKFCAGKDGISTTEFVERHLATVQRELSALGMEARESNVSAYRRFIEQGGNLDIVVNYSPTIDAAVYNDEDWERWLNRAQGQLTAQERSTPLSVRSIDKRPLPESDEYKSVWEIVRSEQERRNASAASSSDTAAGVATTADKPVPIMAVAIASSAEELSKGEDVLYAEQSDDEERPRIIEDYTKLSAEVGQNFMLYTKGKKAIRVEIAGMDEGILRVRRYLRSGWLEQGIKRSAFERAERVR